MWQYGKTRARDLWQELGPRLAAWDTRPGVELRSETDEPIWGVCWRSAATPGGLILNLCNYRKNAATFQIVRGKEHVHTQDVLTAATGGGQVTLQPLETRLLLLKNP